MSSLLSGGLYYTDHLIFLLKLPFYYFDLIQTTFLLAIAFIIYYFDPMVQSNGFDIWHTYV